LILTRRQWHDNEVPIKGRGHSASPRHPQHYMQITIIMVFTVVVDGDGLSEEQMRRFAALKNLAETTFLLPPEDPSADYKVRIFTPPREMPFAGHPTLGSCTAWLDSGGVPRDVHVVRHECGVGIVEIDISRESELAFEAPRTLIEPLPYDAQQTILAERWIFRQKRTDARSDPAKRESVVCGQSVSE
ncbi:MAG: PhzF family phenazine biosynthesis isomerase, partial [Acidihalobacter sp.]